MNQSKILLILIILLLIGLGAMTYLYVEQSKEIKSIESVIPDQEKVSSSDTFS
jgi:CHASE3 domain sensor protein